MGELASNVPGSEKSKEAYETYVEIGELLSGNIKEEVIGVLESKFLSSPLYPKILIAWCLANTYSRLDLMEKSSEKLNYCKEIVPYCKPLLRIVEN
ncbi:hypothetical protein GC093_08345 [Paenibacillus sp. LMG 31456]|uniref:Uncharacterized protein n=1 Tax=Paenibacillus foliorum TaxID=2654974 RepID=A0A972GM25_9BACL|nr:hypothetical protein [Paenibacillus foliorum]NOU93229.1 hypothetical protein [Paenibacillus foliorum]